MHLVATAFLALVAAALPAAAAVNLCSEHHGYAGENSSFSLEYSTAQLTGNQKFVLYARSLSAEGSVQLRVGSQSFPADEPVILPALPPSPVEITVLAKTLDLSPFTFISYVANADVCRLPLNERNLAVPLPVIDGQPAVAYFEASPMSPFTFFTVTVSAANPVTAVFRKDLATPLEQGTDIPMNVPVGDAIALNNPVYVAAKAGSQDGALARISLVWSVPPPGWRPPTPAPEGSSWRQNAAAAARASGSFFGSFLVTVTFGFLAYMVIRSVYNYRQLGITTYPDYIPHHEFFAGVFDRVQSGAENIRGRMDRPGNPLGGVAGSGVAPNTRRGYEQVGGAQP